MKFLAKYVENPLAMSLVYSSYGQFQVKLASSNSIQLYVRIVDDMGAVAVYTIPVTLGITLKHSVLSDVVQSVISNNCGNDVVESLQAGDMQQTPHLAFAIADSLNKIASLTVNASVPLPTNDERVAVRDILVKNVCDLPMSDVSSVKLVASSLSTLSSRTDENSISSAVRI